MEKLKEIGKSILMVIQWIWMIYYGLGQAIGIPDWILIAIPVIVALWIVYKIFFSANRFK